MPASRLHTENAGTETRTAFFPEKSKRRAKLESEYRTEIPDPERVDGTLGLDYYSFRIIDNHSNRRRSA